MSISPLLRPLSSCDGTSLPSLQEQHFAHTFLFFHSFGLLVFAYSHSLLSICISQPQSLALDWLPSPLLPTLFRMTTVGITSFPCSPSILSAIHHSISYPPFLTHLPGKRPYKWLRELCRSKHRPSLQSDQHPKRRRHHSRRLNQRCFWPRPQQRPHHKH